MQRRQALCLADLTLTDEVAKEGAVLGPVLVEVQPHRPDGLHVRTGLEGRTRPLLHHVDHGIDLALHLRNVQIAVPPRPSQPLGDVFAVNPVVGRDLARLRVGEPVGELVLLHVLDLERGEGSVGSGRFVRRKGCGEVVQVLPQLLEGSEVLLLVNSGVKVGGRGVHFVGGVVEEVTLYEKVEVKENLDEAVHISTEGGEIEVGREEVSQKEAEDREGEDGLENEGKNVRVRSE